MDTQRFVVNQKECLQSLRRSRQVKTSDSEVPLYYRCILVGRRMDRFWWHPQPAIYRCITSANFNLDRILILHNHRFGLARFSVGNFESPCQQVVVAPQPPATGLP